MYALAIIRYRRPLEEAQYELLPWTPVIGADGLEGLGVKG